MRNWHLITFWLAVYSLVLVATAPAAWVDASLRQASDGRVRLAEAGGTLWSGRGQIEIRDLKLQTGIARRIGWRLVPEYLMLGKLRYDVLLGGADKSFPVTVSFSRVEATRAEIDLPAAVLGLADPRLAPLELAGDVLLRVERFSFERDAVEGSGTLQWRDAGSALAPVSPLGDYELRFKGNGSVVSASLHTLQGPMQLDGAGTWARGRNPEFLGTARVAPQHRQQLAPLMRMIAVERGDGSFTLQLK